MCLLNGLWWIERLKTKVLIEIYFFKCKIENNMDLYYK